MSEIETTVEAVVETADLPETTVESATEPTVVETTVDAVVEPTEAVTQAEPAPVVRARQPSKKSQADRIFAEKMELRAAGQFASNRDFRAAVLAAMQEELGVSTASAATMYNTAKKEAEARDPEVGLGRDPRREVVKTTGTGRRGRPVGSKNRPKTVVIPAQPDQAADTEAATGSNTVDLNQFEPAPF